VNWVDVVILGAVAVAVLAGGMRGAVRTVFSAAGIVAGFLIASRESGAVGVLFQKLVRPELAAVLGFVAVFFGIALAFTLAGVLFRKVLSGLMLGWLDRIAGAALGLLQAAVALGVLALVIEGFGSFPAARRSVTYPYALEAGAVLLRVIPEDTLERLHWDRLRDRLGGALDGTVI
jgi:membrane protein required for colicin V production